jgi:beta-lactamase regulating signal transducer with metallopeptidase domain
MLDYFFTNIAINLIAICVLIILRDSPARLRFYIVISALFAWFIPWNLISTIPIMSGSLSPLTDEFYTSWYWLENYKPISFGEATNTITPTTSTFFDNIENVFYKLLTVGTFFIVMSAIGFFFFIKDIVSYNAYLKSWHNTSKEDNDLWEKHGFKQHNVSIRILDGCSPGMATGPINPTIWLNKNYHQSKTTKTILTHELIHILQNDPIWMWFITFTQRVLWWNPFVLLFANIAREQLELSCDEKCRQQLQDRYSIDLAEILLNGSKHSTNYIAATSIKNSTNFNIKRIEKLMKENKMKTKHILALLMGVSMIGFVGATVSYQKQPTTQNAISTEDKPKVQRKIDLYRESVLHNELVDELLQMTQLAKSNDPKIISQILLDLNEWNVKRRIGPDQQSERSLKLMSFTMICYLLDKQDRYAEIPATYKNLFPEHPIEKAMFLKHHVATAYIKMGAPEKAIDLMAGVIERQPKPKTGSLMLIAHANLAAENYNEVLVIAEQIALSSKQKSLQIKALNYKRAAYIAMGNRGKADEVDNVLEKSYLATGSAPMLMGFASPILAYLPEVKSFTG